MVFSIMYWLAIFSESFTNDSTCDSDFSFSSNANCFCVSFWELSNKKTDGPFVLFRPRLPLPRPSHHTTAVPSRPELKKKPYLKIFFSVCLMMLLMSALNLSKAYSNLYLMLPSSFRSTFSSFWSKRANTRG